MEDERHSFPVAMGESPTPPPPPPPSGKVAGGWNSIKYILGNESFEKLASMSLVSNITVYLRTNYNMSGVLLVNVVTIWNGSCNLASLAGAIISDAYLGRFRTLLFGSLASFLGMGMIALTAALPQLRPPTCRGVQSQCLQPEIWQLGFLFAGLALLSAGAGGIRPCNIAFGADQFDTATEKGRKQLESFFNWWYFSFTIALIIALSGVVYVQTNISWALGFAIPTACLCCSITIFLLGRHSYIYVKPRGCPFLDIVKVITAAISKRRATPDTAGHRHCSLYEPLSEEESVPRLPRTGRFKCLDKAAMILSPSELDAEGLARNTWKLCSVQKVEHLKCIVGILPVWLSGIACFVAMDQLSTFGVLQAIQMDRSAGGGRFQIPPGWLTLASMAALSAWIFVYERIYVPRARRIANREGRLSIQQRIRAGIVSSILCMVAAGLVERRRRAAAEARGSFEAPMSVGWLVPQFVLSGLTEAFAAVAIMEFLTTHMPENMRTLAGAIFFLSLAVASYVSSALVNAIRDLSGRKGGSPWLGGHDLNENRLEYYYYIIAALGAINFAYFDLVARRFVMVGGGGSGMRETEMEIRRRASGAENPAEETIAAAAAASTRDGES